MPNDYQYIELSFINDYSEIKRQIINTVAITYLLQEGFEPISLNSYLESTQYGYNASAKPEGKHLLTRITDINGGAVNWNNVPFCDCDDEEKYLLKKHDILIARTGGTTGKTYLINEVPPNAIFASYLIRLRANKKCLPDFMSIFLNSYVFWSQISELKSGSAQPNVNAEKLKTLSIPDCPIAVQRKVVAIISEIDVEGDLFSSELKEKIEGVLSVFNSNEEIKKELEQQQTYLQLLRQTILQEAVQGKLTKQDPTDEPATELLKRVEVEKDKLIKAGKLKKEKELPPITEDEIPFKLPEGWVWCRLVEVALFSEAGKSFQCSERPIEGDEWGIIKMNAISSGNFRETENKFFKKEFKEEQVHKIQEGDVLFARASGSKDLTGISCIVKSIKANLLLNDKTIRFRFPEEIQVEYINYWNNCSFGRNYYSDIMGSKTTTMNNITREQFNNLITPLPPLAEQRRILAKVQQLQQQLSQLEVQVQQSRQYAQQLLQSVLKEAFKQKGKVYEMEEEVISMVAEG